MGLEPTLTILEIVVLTIELSLPGKGKIRTYNLIEDLIYKSSALTIRPPSSRRNN